MTNFSFTGGKVLKFAVKAPGSVIVYLFCPKGGGVETDKVGRIS